MKTVAITHPKIKQIKNKDFFTEFRLCGESITIGLMEFDEIELNDEKHAHFVLIKKKAFSCNYRDKSMMLTFSEMCNKKSNSLQYFFSSIGSEFVGEVIAIGKNVSSLAVGDRVIPDGTFPMKKNNIQGGLPTNFASQRLEILHELQLMKIPDEISDEVAASLTIAGHTVYSMLRKLSIENNMNILITAATSNTSLMAIEALKKYHANVYAYTTNQSAKQKLYNMGIQEVFSPENKNRLLEFSKLIQGFDIVLDPFFDLYLVEMISCMKNGSRYITCGLYNQSEKFNQMELSKECSLSEIMKLIMVKNITLIGNCLGEKSDLENAINDIKEKKFNIIIDSVFSQNQILDFFDRSFNSRDRFGKVVYKYE